MFQRLRRSTIGFGLVLAAYTVYRFTAVPFIEPSVDKPAQVRNSRIAAARSRSAISRLTRLFPPGSWQLDDPIKLENDHSILLMQKYNNLPDGRVEMFPCAIVFFPADSSGGSGDEPQGRVIVLDAPQGAVAQFDQPLDLQKGKIGRLLGSQFHGPVTIHGTPSRPGGTDDIVATTQNVQMNTELIWTPEPVDFRFGQNTGHGRDLQIHLLPSSNASEHGTRHRRHSDDRFDARRSDAARFRRSGGIMPMDARHHDEKPTANPPARPADEKPPAMSAAPVRRPDLPVPVPDLAAIERQQEDSGFAGAGGAPNGPPASPAITKKPKAEPDPPTDIHCKGKFRFDMVQYQATFEDQVEVLRTPHDGPSDQMTCEHLIVHFAPRDPAASKSVHPATTASSTKSVGTPAASPAASGASNQKMPNLEPRRIEARGSQTR